MIIWRSCADHIYICLEKAAWCQFGCRDILSSSQNFSSQTIEFMENTYRWFYLVQIAWPWLHDQSASLLEWQVIDLELGILPCHIMKPTMGRPLANLATKRVHCRINNCDYIYYKCVNRWEPCSQFFQDNAYQTVAQETRSWSKNSFKLYYMPVSNFTFV